MSRRKKGFLVILFLFGVFSTRPAQASCKTRAGAALVLCSCLVGVSSGYFTLVGKYADRREETSVQTLDLDNPANVDLADGGPTTGLDWLWVSGTSLGAAGSGYFLFRRPRRPPVTLPTAE